MSTLSVEEMRLILLFRLLRVPEQQEILRRTKFLVDTRNVVVDVPPVDRREA